MATKNTSIDYFPFDVNFFEDDKILFTSAKFGLKGEVLAVRLLCKIYSEGYFYRMGEDEALLFAKRLGDGCDHSFVTEVVLELVKRGFFDKIVFDKFKVLTSAGIQRRYLEATSRRKRVEMYEGILLIDTEKSPNVYILPENAYTLGENGDISKQSKVKESKVKESNNFKSIDEQSTQGNLNYEDIINFFNSKTKGVFGEVRYPISEKRKGMLRARIREHGKVAFAHVVESATNSEFLKGENNRGFKATFDWLIKPNNFQKTLEGNYDNRIKHEKTERDIATEKRHEEIAELARVVIKEEYGD